MPHAYPSNPCCCRYYTVFDRTNLRVGFARARPNPAAVAVAEVQVLHHGKKAGWRGKRKIKAGGEGGSEEGREVEGRKAVEVAEGRSCST